MSLFDDIFGKPEPLEFPKAATRYTGHTPNPMPEIRVWHQHAKELRSAADRAVEAWNRDQLEDAVNSVEFFLAKIKDGLNSIKKGGEL